MGCYSVRIEVSGNKQKFKPIDLLFPSGVIKELFPLNKEFMPSELISEIIEAMSKCTVRLVAMRNTEAIQPMLDSCKKASASVIEIARLLEDKACLKVIKSCGIIEPAKRVLTKS